MKIKRFFAKDMRTALQDVKAALGADAVIMSNKRVNGGVELVAAIDPDARRPAQPAAQQATQPAAQASTQSPAADEEPADSLQALLKRQAERLGEAPVTHFGGQSLRQPPAPAESDLAEVVSHSSADDQADQPSFEQATPDQSAVPGGRHGEQSHAENTAMKDLQAEMADIKNLLKHQVSGLLWQEMERSEPTRAMLIKRLKDMGLEAKVADQLSCFIPDTDGGEEAWEQTLHILEGQIHTTRDDILTQGGVVALVGPTGVGKTTTIAKLAARFAQQHGKDQVAMVSTDTFRIGATEQLQTYGRIIGCPVKVARDARELSDTLLQLRQKKLVLIDTAGMGQRDLRLSEQLATLMSNTRLKIRPYLCLAATAQVPVLQDILRQFQKLPLAGCILTKLDECMSLGEVLSVAIEHALPVSYVTDGQQVPEDLKAAEASFLVAEAERLFEKSICSNTGYMTSFDQRASSDI